MLKICRVKSLFICFPPASIRVQTKLDGKNFFACFAPLREILFSLFSPVRLRRAVQNRERHPLYY